MPLPRISIITPSFNQAIFIDENIQSVLRQGYPEVEHIIIDGGSTDGTLDVLKKYGHLKWVSEPDRGQSHALNKGFKMATGEIIGWLNSDDTYFPEIFHAVAKEFEDPAVRILCGNGYEIDENSRRTHPLYTRNVTPEILIKYWKWKFEFLQPAIFFRRSVFEEAGFLDEKLFYVMDYDFFIRLSLKYPFRYTDRDFANLRMHGESKTGKTYRQLIPKSIWELHRVSRRYWGGKMSWRYYEHLFSFIGALFLSFFKNLFFLPGSKSRMQAGKLLR